MAGLQRSSISFRRQGSSGFVWDDKFLSAELNQLPNQKEDAAPATATTADTATASESSGARPQEYGSDLKQKQEQQVVKDHQELVVKVSKIERSLSGGGGRGFRTGRVSPAIEPPSPKVSACGFCSAFAKHDDKTRQRAKPGKRKSL